MKTSLILFSILYILSFGLFGKQKQFSIEGAGFSGGNFILTPSVDFEFSVQGFQAKYIKQSSQMKNWQKYYNLPRTGKEVFFSQYSVNGYSTALHTFIEFDFLRSTGHDLFISPGIGLAYTSETSETISEYRLVSLPINFSVRLELGYRFYLTPNWRISAGYLLNHISNGNTSNPNDGLNMKAWKLGIAYSYGTDYAPDHFGFQKSDYKRFIGQLSFGGGVKSKSDRPSAFFNGFLNAGIGIHPYHRFLAGMGIFTDNPINDRYGRTQLGFNLGYQILFGEVAFSFQPGWYLRTFQGSSNYYLLAVQYQLKESLFLQATLRTSAKFFAEDLAIGLGFEI